MTDITATILIVDDSPTARETLKTLLSHEPYQVVEAAGGDEALQKAREHQPDLILLDVMMPEMDGYEVCRRIRADPLLAEVPVIMVTALDDRASRLQGLGAGADDFISKPYDTTELRLRVRTITRLNRYRRLHAQRERFELVVAQAQDGYLITDADDTIRYANDQARLLLELPPDESATSPARFLETVLRRYRREPEAAWRDWTNPSHCHQDACPARKFLFPLLLAPGGDSGKNPRRSPRTAHPSPERYRVRGGPTGELDLPDHDLPQTPDPAQRRPELSGAAQL
jgi:DNA-binding response OmpR family regulator